ncbi:MAG: cytochrome b/b6 domain-containing protein, partial [Pseudomonas sp.]
MTLKTPPARYGGLSITLHWLMLVLLAAVYALIELRGLFPKDSVERNLMKDLHFMLGLTVFVLVWLRLALRLSRPTPPIVPAPPAWQTGLAHLMHLALYLLMIGLPIA